MEDKSKKVDKRLGNQFWKLRAKDGRDKLFKSPEKLWEAACEYFQWCDDNPLSEQKLFAYQGSVIKEDVSKLRVYTLMGLCLYLDCSEAYFRNFKAQERKEKKEFITVIERIEATIYNQQFSAAASELVNPNIIARNLGLVDKVHQEIVLDELSPEERLKRIRKLEEKLKKD